jgi:phosphatidylinositol glycan class U
VNSFKRLQEGLFLYTRNVSPYDGGVFHQVWSLRSLLSWSLLRSDTVALGAASSSYIRSITGC